MWNILHTCFRYVVHKVTELLPVTRKIHDPDGVVSIAVVSMTNYGNPNARDFTLEPLHCFCNVLTNLHSQYAHESETWCVCVAWGNMTWEWDYMYMHVGLCSSKTKYKAESGMDNKMHAVPEYIRQGLSTFNHWKSHLSHMTKQKGFTVY